MAPRRVAAALTDDTLENSIRDDILGVQGNQGDDQQDDAGQSDDQQDGADQGDDDQQDAADQGDDDQQDDADQGDDQPDEPSAPRQRRQPAHIREPDDRLSPAVEARIAASERIAADAVARADALMQQFGQPRETAEQEAARLAMMTPEQIIDYKVNKALGQVTQTFQRSTFAAQNSSDKASFDAQMAGSPQLKRFAADVERKHSDLVREAQRTGAGIPTRQTVLTYMLGERALELAQKAAPQQGARERRVARQQVRPGTSRSDVSPARRQQSTVEQRLEGVQL